MLWKDPDKAEFLSHSWCISIGFLILQEGNKQLVKRIGNERQFTKQSGGLLNSCTLCGVSRS